MESTSFTVLLIELPGFAMLSIQSSSKELNILLKEVYEISDSTVRLHQGTIFNFSGDHFSVVFNSSKSGAASALSAIEAVNEFKERLNAWFKDKKLSADFSVKAGIALGDAIVEEFGTADKKHVTVMGEALSFATRLREFAEEGQVLVNEDVFEAAKDHYNFQKLEPLPIRGSKKSLPVFELKDKKRAKLTPETFSERRIASEMVGRNAEVEALEGCIKKLIAGKGSVVNIIGKAGIGKSRLVEEMKAQAFMSKVRLLEGRALSMGKSLSFHPITHIIKSWAGISEEDPPAVSSKKLQTSILRGAKDQADEIFPFIATMMGLPLQGKAKDRVAGIEGEALEKLILKNLRDLITSAATIRPLIIMIEDMHWADSSSISFLESLYKLAPKNRVMFINVLRPGYEETGDYILKYLEETLPDDHQNIIIEALVETESKELIGNLLNRISLPAGVTNMIIRKTEGNPFFIEEVIRSFIDDGIIETKGKEFRITEKISQANIPETINEVILSRVDKLDEKTKDLLKTASVIGRNFYYKVLEEAADTIGELDDRLEYLKEVQLIGESKKKDEIEYLFKHALAQQATYESIIQNTKKELHLKIARSIEKVFAENIHEFYGTLAYHYELAENKEKTLDYLVKAGNEAMGTGGSADVINYYNKALKFYPLLNKKTNDVDLLKNIYLSLGKAYHSRGMANEAVEVLDKALLLFGFKFPKSKIRLMAGFIYNLIYYVFAVYNDKYFFNKSNDPNRDQLFEILFNRGRTLSSISSKRFIIEGFYSTKPLFSTDLSKNPNAFAVFVGFSAGFFWTGISLKTSSRIFKVSERFIGETDTHAYQVFKYSQKMHNYHCGILETDNDLDFLFDFYMKKGFFFEAAYILFYNGFCYGDKGNRQECQKITANLLLVAIAVR
ncbi:MAG: AAA family ATPase [Bacteroidales bacterium]|nr:AAA family ATPase [Bacteroidales bacterium]MCF8458900.1 AAA family ATPase [Bacteroidales bacterium]